MSYCKAYQERFCILEYAKFRGSHATVALVDLVPSRHRAFVGISCVQISPPGYFMGPKFFSHGHFVGLDFLLGIIVGPKNFRLGIS